MLRLALFALLAFAAVSYMGRGCDPSASHVGDLWTQIQMAVANGALPPNARLSLQAIPRRQRVSTGGVHVR